MSQVTARDTSAPSRHSANSHASTTARVLTYRVLTSSPLADTVNISHADKVQSFVSNLITEYGPLVSHETRTLSLYSIPLYCRSSMDRIRRHIAEIDLPPSPDTSPDIETSDSPDSPPSLPSVDTTSSAYLPGALLYAGLGILMGDKSSQRYSGIISRMELLDGLTARQETQLHQIKSLFKPSCGKDLGVGTCNMSIKVHLGLAEYAKSCGGQLGVSISTLCGPALMYGISQSPGVNPEVREECNGAAQRWADNVHNRCGVLEEILHGMGY